MTRRNPEFLWNAWHVAALSAEVEGEPLVARIIELDRDAAGEQQFVDFFKGIFAHAPVILPRDKGAVLVRRIVGRRIAAEQRGQPTRASE